MPLLVTPRRRGETSETLRRLHERSLVEGTGGRRYTLQPVIMEFITRRLVERVSAELEGGTVDLLGSHALMTAQQTKEYIRETQRRLIVGEVLAYLRGRASPLDIEEMLKRLLVELRRTQPGLTGYAAGNILNMLIT